MATDLINFSKSEFTSLARTNGDRIKRARMIFKWVDKPVGRFQDKGRGGVNADGAGLIFDQDNQLVQTVYPEKGREVSALDGAIVHRGDVTNGKTGGGETIDVDFGRITTVNFDIECMGIAVTCSSGDFDKVREATIEIWDTSEVDPGKEDEDPGVHVGNLRIPIEGANKGAVVGIFLRDNQGWVWRTSRGKFSPDATSYEHIKELVRSEVVAARLALKNRAA